MPLQPDLESTQVQLIPLYFIHFIQHGRHKSPKITWLKSGFFFSMCICLLFSHLDLCLHSQMPGICAHLSC